MSFLNSFFLWMLPLIGLPVLIHLIHLRPPKKMVFSHIPWLRLAHQSAMPRKKLKERLLMLVRTLFLLFLIAFFLRPLLHVGGGLWSPSKPGSIIFMLDISASMGQNVSGQTALYFAVEKIKETLRLIPPESRVGLILYSDQVEAEWPPTSERSQLLSYLDKAEVAYRPTNVKPALEAAYKMLHHQGSSKSAIILVSDQARHGWKELNKGSGQWEGFNPETIVLALEVLGPSPNRGVKTLAVSLKQDRVLKGGWNLYQVGKFSEGSWEVKINESTVARGILNADSSRLDGMTFDARIPEGGFFSGQLSLSPDAYSFDDVFYLAGRVPRGYNLLLIDGDSGLSPSDSEVFYLRSALENPKDPRVKQITVVRPDNLSSVNLQDYDVIVAANTGSLEEYEEEIISWVRSGGGLMLSAGSKWPKSPKSPLSLFQSAEALSKQTNVHLPEKIPDYLERVADIQNFQWSETQVQQYLKIDGAVPAEPLLLTGNNDMLMGLWRLGKGVCVFYGTTLDRQWNNLPAKPVFPALMRELLSTLADPSYQKISLSGWVGEPFRVKIRGEAKAVNVIAPDNRVGAARLTSNNEIEWTDTNKPGLYRVQTGNADENFSFAINVPSLESESNPERISESELRNFFPKAPVYYIPTGTESHQNLLSHLQGRDLTTTFLILMILCFLAESILGWSLRQRRKAVA